MLPNWPLTIAISDATRLSRASCSVASASIESGHQVTLSVFSCPPPDVTSPNAFLNRSFSTRNAAISLFFASRSVYHRLKTNANNANSTVTSNPVTPRQTHANTAAGTRSPTKTHFAFGIHRSNPWL